MTSPSMVQRAGDTLVVRSLVSGDQLFVNDSGTEQYSEDADCNDDVMIDEDDKALPQCKIRRNYSCSNCNYFTQNPRHFLYHLRDVHQEKVKIYECPHCLYASKHFQKLLRHMKMVHGNSDNLEFCESSRHKPHKKKKLIQIQHRRKSDNDSKVAYEFPDKRARLQSKHFEDTTKSADLKCSLCSFTTRHQGQLTRHERQEHIKTKFFRCTKCSYVTHIKARFTKHVKYHSMPMIKCDLCDFRTPYKWNLDRHYKNHNGNGSFRCSACNFTADIKQSLTVHEMNHHVPPVGQAAGLGVGRRRNKVGASDTTAAEDEELELEMRHERERNRTSDCAQRQPFPQSSTSMQYDESIPSNKKNPKIKLSIKRPTTEKNEPRNFYMDFIHSDDIIHHSNGNVYIKRKCKYCSYKTAWDTEMEKHERKVHNVGENIIQASTTPKKVPRPIPNLIPIGISPTNSETSCTATKAIEQSTDDNEDKSLDVHSVINLSDIKDLSAKAGFSSLHDFISLFGDDEFDAKNSATESNFNNSKTETSVFHSTSSENNSPVTQTTLETNNSDLKKKQTSFFDNLKAKLMTNAGESCNLTCKWCAHESKCLSELAGHQKTCGKEASSSYAPSKVHNVSSTRCQYCRQRCKSSSDLFNHLQICPDANQPSSKNCSFDAKSENSESMKLEEFIDDPQEPHPMENVVFVWNNISQQTKTEESKLEDKSDEMTNIEIARDQSVERSIECERRSEESEESIECTPLISTYGNITKMPTHGNDLDLVSEGKRVFKCPHCSFWASTASRFHVHIVGHLNKKPFECSLCSYRSNWRWDITKHIRLKTVRDPAHSKARVLMTDETGRRNYSKYNKYLTQMKASKVLGEKEKKYKSVYEMNQGRVSPNEMLPQLPKLLRATSASETKGNTSVSLLRPPPPLRPAYVTYIQNEQNKKRTDTDVKKTLFKCKKCNFRDANRENILLHVKGHYRQDVNNEPNIDEEVSVSSSEAPFRCGHCHQVSNWKHVIQRHCRLKHSGDVRVVIGGKNGTAEKLEVEDQSDEVDHEFREEDGFKCNQCSYLSKSYSEYESHMALHGSKPDSDLKCCFCSYITAQKYLLYDHLKLHGVADPEDYISKAMKEKSTNHEEPPDVYYIKKYKCMYCPYISNSKSQFLYHKQFHRPRGAQFKCKFCSYNVTRRHLLNQHLRIHGIAMTTQLDLYKSSLKEDGNIKSEDVTSSTTLQLDENQIFEDVPLVWVSKGSRFSKMYKCRYCPHLNMRKANIQEHEKMHMEHIDVRENIVNGEDVSYSCPDCSYVCNNAGVLSAHFKTHQGYLGQIHCLVDPSKTDEEQITELTNLLNKSNNYQNPDDNFAILEDVQENVESDSNMDHDTELEQFSEDTVPEKVLYFCQKCPARYLFEKEFETHNRFHGSRLFYRCEYCSYTARQRPHLLAHYSVHTEEYQEETKKLLAEYVVSHDYAPPQIAVSIDGPAINNEPAWGVMGKEGSASDRSSTERYSDNSYLGRVNNKKFLCSKCPTKFYNNELLQYHMTLHGGRHPYKCNICDYSAISRNNLEKHHRIHCKENGEEKCKEMPQIHISVGNIPIEPGSNLYQQILDARKQSSDKILLKNNNVSLLESDSQNDNTNVKYCPLMQNMKSNRLKEKQYQCAKCPSTFEKREQYKIHLSLHGSKQRYQCENCDYSVKYYANYVQHIRKHEIDNTPGNHKSQKRYLEDSDTKDFIIEDTDEAPLPSKMPKLAVKTLQSPSKPGMLKLSVADRQTLMILQENKNCNSSPKDISADDRKLHWCPHCPYTSYRRDAVDNHLNRHICISGVQSNYTCEHCDYTVPQSHFLREHTKSHFGSFKIYQPEGFMVYKKMKLSSKIDSNEEKNMSVQDENVLFQDAGNKVKSDQKYKPLLDSETLLNLNRTDVKIYINLSSQEVIENSTPTNEDKDSETKDEGKSS